MENTYPNITMRFASLIANGVTNVNKWLTKNISAAWLLILLFGYTAFSKVQFFTDKNIIDVSQFRNDMFKSPVIRSYVDILAYTIPGIEFLICIMLLTKPTKLIGYYTALILLCSFSGYIIYMMLSYPRLPCTCGGMLQHLSWENHLLVNICFILITTRAILLTHKQNRTRLNHYTKQ